LRGEVLTFDEATGMGAIVGDDGVRYLFSTPEVRSATQPVKGQRVDFVGTEDGQAKEIFTLTPSVAPAAPTRVGEFDLGRVIQRTFTSIRQNAAVFFGAAVVLVGAPSVLSVIGQGTGYQEMSAGGFAFTAIGTVLNFIGMFVLQGMVVKAAVNGFSGKTTAFGDAFDVAVKTFLPLLGLAITAGLGMMLGFILLIVPGVILSVIWSVGAPVVVVEKRGVMESLQRSRDLTRGFRWQVFGLLVIYTLVSWIIGAAIGGLSMALGGAFTDIGPNLWVNLATGPLVNILSGVIGSAGVASLFYELKTAKEGGASEDLAAVFD
jgi:hypothetical protein